MWPLLFTLIGSAHADKVLCDPTKALQICNIESTDCVDDPRTTENECLQRAEKIIGRISPGPEGDISEPDPDDLVVAVDLQIGLRGRVTTVMIKRETTLEIATASSISKDAGGAFVVAPSGPAAVSTSSVELGAHALDGAPPAGDPAVGLEGRAPR